jgi:hypothetical protein
MPRAHGSAPGAYARAVEKSFSALRGRPVILSPRDWSLVADWHARGIPLRLVLEVLGEVGEARKRRGADPPRSLAYLAPAVEEASAVFLSGRMADPDEPPGAAEGPAGTTAFSAWERSARQGAGTPLGAILRSLLERRREGEDTSVLDRELDAALPDAVETELRAEAEREALAALAPFRRRMPPEAWEATRRRAEADHLRRRLGLPRLALSATRGGVVETGERT